METKKAYDSLTELVFKGFLSAELNLDGNIFIIKTVNEKEFDLIKMYSGKPNEGNYQTKFNIYFLVFSLFMFNNKNLLVDRSKNIEEFYCYFSELPGQLIKNILKNLNELRSDSYDVLKYLEGFSYTEFSRSNWKFLNGNFPCNEGFTGIPGSSGIGMNIHQESWILINKAMDYEEDYNKDFSLALMIASSSNPKGSRHIRNQFDSSKKMVEDRRKKLAKEGFIDVKKWSPEGWAAPVDTAEELVAELERQMTGVKDRHDIFMENYMKKIREQAEKKAKEAEDNIRRAQEGRDNVFIDGEQRVMTPEEMEALNYKKQRTTETVPEEVLTSEDKDKFYKKIGARVLTGK
jgi:hypothetical protein